MKKQFLSSLLITFIFLANPAVSQTLDDILKKHFEAVGQNKLVAANSIFIKAKVSQMGMDIPIEMKVKHVDIFRIEFEVQGQKMVQLYDGEKGWIIAPGLDMTPQEVTGDMLIQLKQQPETIIGGDLFDYKTKGSLAEFAGKVNLEGKEAFRIILTTADGNVKEYLIDTDTYYIVKSTSKVYAGGQSIAIEEKMLEFKTFDGITFATKIEQKTPLGNSIINIDTITFNENFDDAIFRSEVE